LGNCSGEGTVMKIGNAPCSWGVFYPSGNAITPLDYLDAVARAGYRWTELGPLGFLGEDPVWIADALLSRNLGLAGSAHVHTLADPASNAGLTGTLHRLGRLLAALGSSDLILMDESEYYPPAAQGVVDNDGWQTAMTMIRNADTLLRDGYGITLHLHPHVGTCIERETQIDRLLSETGVSLCLDTGHHAFWNQDVLACIDRIWPRIGFVHLKNVDPGVRARVLAGELGVNAAFGHGVMCALADGAVDIRAVMRKLVAVRYDGTVIVEQDPAKDAILAAEALARTNLAFLTGALA
jgi:inosose dehydratase